MITMDEQDTSTPERTTQSRDVVQPILHKVTPTRLGAVALLAVSAILIGYSVHLPILLPVALVLFVLSALLRRKTALFLILRGNREDRDFPLLLAAMSAAYYADGLWLKNLQGKSLPFPTIPLGGTFVTLLVLTNFAIIYLVFDVGWSENVAFNHPTLAFSLAASFAVAWVAARRWIMTSAVFFAATLLLVQAETLGWRDSLRFLETPVVFWVTFGTMLVFFLVMVFWHESQEGRPNPKLLRVDRLLVTRFVAGGLLIFTGLVYTRPWTESYAGVSTEVIWVFLALCVARLGGELVRVVRKEPLGRIAITNEASLKRIMRATKARRTFIGALRLFDPAPIIEINTPLEKGTLWQSVVAGLCQHVNFVMLDVTAFAEGKLDLERGLGWELLYCARNGVQLVLVCDKEKFDQATANLEPLFGDVTSIVVPLDTDKKYNATLANVIAVASSSPPLSARIVASDQTGAPV